MSDRPLKIPPWNSGLNGRALVLLPFFLLASVHHASSRTVPVSSGEVFVQVCSIG